MKVYYLFTVLLASVYYSHAAVKEQPEEKGDKVDVKSLIIQEIMSKISNITLAALAKAPNTKREFILGKIRKRLMSTASNLKDGQKYVDIIMGQFSEKLKNIERTRKETTRKPTTRKTTTTTESTSAEVTITTTTAPSKKLTTTKSTDEQSTTEVYKGRKYKVIDNSTKQHIVEDIASKIETMAKGYLRATQTAESKKKLLQKIKRRLLESSRRKHVQIHNQHHELKTYTDLISKGFELSLKRLLNTSARRTEDDHQFIAAINNYTEDTETHINIMNQIGQYSMFFSEIYNTSEINQHCSEIVVEICRRVDNLNELKCGVGRYKTLDKLCNGETDCLNEADEKNCSSQVLKKIQDAMSMLLNIGLAVPRKCMTNGDTFIPNNNALLNLLHAQSKNIKIDPSPMLFTSLESSDMDDVFSMDNMNAVREIKEEMIELISSFKDALCSVNPANKNNNYRRIFLVDAEPTIIPEEKFHQEVKVIAKPCVCDGDSCKSKDCDPSCQLLCSQKFNLHYWECKSITGAPRVSLDVVCDSKFDCYDESDELSCANGDQLSKYEANKLYNDVIDILSLKSLSLEYENSRNKMKAILMIVQRLQKLTTKQYINIKSVKILRDEYFKSLGLIFDDMLQNSRSKDTETTAHFIVALKNMTLKALKRSHMGNELIVTPAGCYCNNGKCGLVKCTRKCNSTCKIEDKIIKFNCNDDLTIDIQSVCDGKADCPNKKDEIDCTKEICRGHHLLVLGRLLQDAFKSLDRGTVLAEVLEGWHTKAMHSILVIKKTGRPSHSTVIAVIDNILRDLVTAYSTMEEFKSTRAPVISEFKRISEVVKQTLKFCSS